MREVPDGGDAAAGERSLARGSAEHDGGNPERKAGPLGKGQRRALQVNRGRRLGGGQCGGARKAEDRS